MFFSKCAAFVAVVSLVCFSSGFLDVEAKRSSGACSGQKVDTLKELVTRKFDQPITISRVSKFYAKPDTLSQVISLLNSNTPLDSLKIRYIEHPKVFDYGSRDIWYTVNVSGKNGFLKGTDVAGVLLAFEEKNEKYAYLLSIEGYSFQYGVKIRLLKYFFGDAKILYAIPIKEINFFQKFSLVKSALGGVVLWVSRDDETDGGVAMDLFYTDNGHGFKKLLSSGAFGDSEDTPDYDMSAIWFPVIIDKEVCFIRNGIVDKDAGYNETDDKLKITLPAAMKSKKNNLIIKTDEQVVTVLDKKGHPIALKEGSFKTKKTNSTTFYSWDGNKLVKLLTQRRVK